MPDTNRLISSISSLPRLVRMIASASASLRSCFSAISRSMSSNFWVTTSLRRGSTGGSPATSGLLPQQVEPPERQGLRGAVGRQVDFVACQHIAALARLGGLNGAAQFDARRCARAGRE